MTSLEQLRELYDLRGARQIAYSGGFEGDFDGILRRAREKAPVVTGTMSELLGLPPSDPIAGWTDDHYTALSWNACNTAFRDGERFSASIYQYAQRGPFGRTFKEMDGREHRRQRELVAHRFVPAQMEWWLERFVNDACDELIASIEADGHADLNLQFFSLLPLYTFTAAYGIDRETAVSYADTFASAGNAWQSRGAAIRVLAPEVAKRRREPEDDLLTALVQAELDDGKGGVERLTDEEVVGVSGVLFTGGLRTTWRQGGTLMYALLTHPEQLEAVRADRSLLRNAIEEVMRWSPAVSVVRRLVTRDTELEGFPLRKGDVLELALSAANRDPARWDDPDSYDLHRPLRSNMGFIVGPHVCLGMHLARLELRHGVERLLDRFPSIRIDPDAEQPRLVGHDHRGVSALPVVWED